MSRLNRKCLFASVTMHALLLALLVVSPAFLPKREKFENLQIITLIPGKLIDDPFVSGGAQSPAPPPAQNVEPPPVATPELRTKPPESEVQQPVQKVQPAPEPIAPVKPQKSLEPTPVPPKTRKETKPTVEPTETPSKKPTAKVTPTFEKAPDNPAKAAEAEARAARDRAARAQQARLTQAIQSLKQDLSSGTDIGIPGPGKEAYMNYGMAIKMIFDAAWQPGDLAENDSTVKALVTILRDGTVSSHEITRPSRIAALDNSVERALRSVTKVPPFPVGAKEDKREFSINFNLKAKRLAE